MSPSRYLAISLTAILVIFLTGNLGVSLLPVQPRLDLTAEQRFTLSPTSRTIARTLSEPVEVTVYFSERTAQNLPAIRNHGERVVALGRALEAASRGKLRVSVVEPAPFSPEEDAAIAAGLISVPTEDGEPFYLGAVGTNSVDERRHVPFFSPDRADLLEFEWARLLSELERPPQEIVSIYSGIALEDFSGPRFFFSELRRAYELRVLDEDFTTISDDSGLLVLIHPHALSPAQWEEVKRFLRLRGRALIFVDPFSRLAAAPAVAGLNPQLEDAPSDLGPLAELIGVSLDTGETVLDAASGLPVDVELDGRVVERVYPAWFRIDGAGLNADTAITGPLANGIHVAAAGVLRPLPATGANVTPLLRSSPDSWTVETALVGDDPLPSALMATQTDALASHVVAALVRGSWPDAEVGDAASYQVVVVADTDLLDDAFYLAGDTGQGPIFAADNAAFFMNAVDVLSGREGLVDLRSANQRERRLTRLDALRADAQRRLQAEEEGLRRDLAAIETRIGELRQASPGMGTGSLAARDRSVETQIALQNAQAALAETRERLRAVEGAFRADIERLSFWLNLMTVWLVPVLVLVAAVVWFSRQRRRRRA